MNEILELLKEALNKMILKQQEAQALVVDCNDLKQKCEKELGEIRAKMQELEALGSQLRARESVVVQNENIAAAKDRLGALEGKLQMREADLKSAENDFENRKALLADKAKSLEAREIALSREQESYKERIKKEIFADLSSGKIKLTIE